MAGADLFGLEGKRALVVGGGLGMGKASAELLASVGVAVAVLDIDEARAANVADAINAAGGQAVPLSADVLNGAGAQQAVSDAARLLGGLDILVNIVGQASFVPLAEMTMETWDLDLNRNLKYVFAVGQAFARLDVPGGAQRSIVSIASVSGLNSAPGHAAYGAAKAGLMSLTRTMAQEWGKLGIRVNAIAPGAIKTDRNQGTPELEATVGAVAPLQRRGRQEEIARAVLFLASDLASYVTGNTLLVDGGVQTRNPFR